MGRPKKEPVNAGTSRIVEMFGGVNAVASLIGNSLGRYFSPATVKSWVNRSGYIPDVYWPILIGIAKKQGKQLTVDDFPKREK